MHYFVVGFIAAMHRSANAAVKDDQTLIQLGDFSVVRNFFKPQCSFTIF